MDDLRVMLFYNETPKIKITVEAFFNGESLTVEGYDIGDSVEEYWGDSDYEYSITIFQGEIPKLFAALDVVQNQKMQLLESIARNFNTNSCFSEFEDFLTRHQIAFQRFTWA